jgi:BirA family transcriptional regulator, biotin operon repressor / biotin---[acetyl-CoA-carboxylase] ligase
LTTLRFKRHDTVDSTNRIAMDLARSGELEGCVVLAESQSAGRGRNGRVWCDQPGKAVLMSLVLRPTIALDALPRLSLAVGVGAARGIESVCPVQIGLKWPNDLIIGDRKVGGILIEADISQVPVCAVAGIGINVLPGSFPPEISDKATYLQAHGDTPLNVEDIAQAAAEQVIATCAELANGRWNSIVDQWRDRMWGVGRAVEIVSSGERVNGVIYGVTGDGALEITDAGGSRAAFISAETITVR